MASRARWASLLCYLLVLGLAAPVLWRLTVVYRAPLPRDELAALSQYKGGDEAAAWPRARIRVGAAPGAFLDEAEHRAFVSSLHAAVARDGAEATIAREPSRALLDLSPCVHGGAPGKASVAAACLESMERAAETNDAAPLDSSFDVLVVAAAGGDDQSALMLDPRRGAVLRWDRRGSLGECCEALAKATAEELRTTWLRRAHLDNEAALFEVAPAYVFSFFLVGDCAQRISWDFRGAVLAPFLQRLLARLRLLVDFDVESQVIQCGSLGGTGSVVSASELQSDFLRRAGDWPGDFVARGVRWLPPLVRFVAFRPSKPLRVEDEQRQTRHSFAVQGWGVVAVVGEGGDGDGSGGGGGAAACSAPPQLCAGPRNSTALLLGPCEAKQAAAAWASGLRSWLALPLDGPLAPLAPGAPAAGGLALHAARPRLDGVASWELRAVARAVHGLFLRRTVETLENLVELIDSLPDVVVREEVANMVFEASVEVRRSAAAAAAGDLPAALASARRGLAFALTAQHDDTVVAQMYFSWEFKSAVYLPIILPVVVPIAAGLARQLRKARAVSLLLRAQAVAAAANGEAAAEKPEVAKPAEEVM